MLSSYLNQEKTSDPNKRTKHDDGVNMLQVDLRLPKDKTPVNPSEAYLGRPRTVQQLIPEYAVGSSKPNELVYDRQLGLFDCIKDTWKNHWVLQTSPEDWWFSVACRIAKAIDEHAEEESVRKFFVDHEGKKNLCVDVNVFSIYEVQYDSFFGQMTGQIQNNIKVPGFVGSMKSDFSTSTPAHAIASQINLMASMQKYFSYEMGICGCGIMGLEMLGEKSDWNKLLTKIQAVKEQLKPILWSIRLYDSWFDHVEYVFRNLSMTYENPDSQEVADFWANILMESPDWKYGPSGFGGHQVDAYNGWLVKFLLDQEKLRKEDLRKDEVRDKLSGLNSVPMTITLKYKSPPVADGSTVIAGISGYQLHTPSKTKLDTSALNGIPRVKPNHMWAIKLSMNSPLRGGKLHQ